MTASKSGAYTADHGLVDYILGITYEIWEEGGVDLIEQYYGPETVVYSLDGITRGSKAMIDGTRAMLAAFPDRLLLGDDVIGHGDVRDGYSSHRVLSPMTNSGQSPWGDATGRQVRILNMADCAIEDAVIVREWLARDNLALVTQLGFDPLACARQVADRQTDDLKEWFADESSRLRQAQNTNEESFGVDAQALLQALWQSGDRAAIEQAYPHYAVLHRSPVEIVSGSAAIDSHYRQLRAAFDIDAASVDHVCRQPAAEDVGHVAIRWSVCGTHVGDYFGIAASGKPVFIMGVTHRRIVNQRVAVEWTVFDSLGVMAQLL